MTTKVGVPAAAIEWVRGVFAAANKNVSAMFGINPNHHEPELDMGLIAALNHAPPVAHPAGWTVYIQTHFLGGRRHFYNWEVADIGLLVVFRDRGKVLRIKVGLLQSKRLYATEEKLLPAHTADFRLGFARLLATPDAFRDLVAGRTFSFARDSRYLALAKGDDQERALVQYERMSGIPVYYLFYNPPTIPLRATVPATKLVSPADPKVGCRIVPARALTAHLASRELGYHPSYADTTSLGSPFVGKHRGGWRLEHFVADLLLRCKQGHVASGETDHVLERLFYRRSGPIAAAIAITIDAPPGADFLLPEATGEDE